MEDPAVRDKTLMLSSRAAVGKQWLQTKIRGQELFGGLKTITWVSKSRLQMWMYNRRKHKYIIQMSWVSNYRSLQMVTIFGSLNSFQIFAILVSSLHYWSLALAAADRDCQLEELLFRSVVWLMLGTNCLVSSKKNSSTKRKNHE